MKTDTIENGFKNWSFENALFVVWTGAYEDFQKWWQKNRQILSLSSEFNCGTLGQNASKGIRFEMKRIIAERRNQNENVCVDENSLVPFGWDENEYFLDCISLVGI